MLKEERQRLILEKLSTSNTLNFGELEKMLGVSYDSIRRDVIELEDKGLLKKVHGAIVANSYLNILSGQKKGVNNGKDLESVIAKAIKLISNNQVILLDGGTTNFFLAENIPKNIKLTVLTNSPPLAMVLNDHDNIEVILLGGKYFKRYQITMGIEILNNLKNFNVDLYFMGINGLDPMHGFTIRNYEESLMKKQMMMVSKKTICCVVEEKINVVENYKVADSNEISYLITNLKPTNAKLIKFKEVQVL